MHLMQEAVAEDRCRYCGTPLEQPASGGRQKRFCSDEHRLRYWRERRRQGLPTGEEAERKTDVRSLSWELQATLLGFQHTVQALASALAEAGDLDTARAIKEQTEAESQRRVAAAEERRARAERLRLEAEAMTEAANAAAQDAQEQARRLELEAEHLRGIAVAATDQAQEVERRADERVAAAHEELARQRGAIEAGARDRVAVAEERAQQAERLLGQAVELRDAVQSRNVQLEQDLATMGQRLQAAEQRRQEGDDAREREAGELRGRLEQVQQQLRQLDGDLAAERQARAEAEQRATALTQLADERARERDRVLQLVDQIGTVRSPRRSAAGQSRASRG